jgi:hypothetical protein
MVYISYFKINFIIIIIIVIIIIVIIIVIVIVIIIIMRKISSPIYHKAIYIILTYYKCLSNDTRAK